MSDLFSDFSSTHTLIVETDGGSRGNPGPAGYGAVILDAQSGEILAERAGFLGVVSNNVAEYTGLIVGLRTAASIDPKAKVLVRADSKLVVEQMSGRWKIKHDDMRRLATEASTIFPHGTVDYMWVPRADNTKADALANEAMDTQKDVVRDYPKALAPEIGDSDQRVAPVMRPSGASPRIAVTTPTTTIIFVRHGESRLTQERRFSGAGGVDPDLEDSGRRQAFGAASIIARIGQDLWPELPGIDQVITSPLKRTQQTAEIIAKPLGLPITIDPAFTEASFGKWEGLTFSEVETRWPEEYAQWTTSGDAHAPGGESMRSVGKRVNEALRRIVSANLLRSVVITAHALTIRAALGIATGANADIWSRFRVLPASVHLMRLSEDGDGELIAADIPPELGLPAAPYIMD